MAIQINTTLTTKEGLDIASGSVFYWDANFISYQTENKSYIDTDPIIHDPLDPGFNIPFIGMNEVHFSIRWSSSRTLKEIDNRELFRAMPIELQNLKPVKTISISEYFDMNSSQNTFAVVESWLQNMVEDLIGASMSTIVIPYYDDI